MHMLALQRPVSFLGCLRSIAPRGFGMNKIKPLTHAEFVAEFAQVLDVADSPDKE